MMVFWIGLNILATEALRTLLGADVPAWAVLLASSGPLYVVAMPLSMLAFTRVPVIRTRQYPMKAGEFIQIFVVCIPVMFLGNMIGNILSAGATDGQATNRINDVILGSDWRVNALFIGLLAPVCEEWIFRKEIISRLRRYGEKDRNHILRIGIRAIPYERVPVLLRLWPRLMFDMYTRAPPDCGIRWLCTC